MKDYNIYADYLLLNEKISQKYSSFKNNFPLSFKTIEWYIRIYESVGIHDLERNFFKRKKLFNKYSYFITRNLFKFYPKNKYRAWVSIPRLKNIQDDSREFLNNNGILCEEFGKGYNIIDSLIGNSLSNLGLYKNLKNFPFEKNYDKKFWIGFESSLEKLIISYSKFLKILNFKIVITQDLHTDTGFILSKILNSLNTPSIEFAHAFTQDRHLVTLLPINGNYSLIWSEILLNKISRASNATEKLKLISFGYPNIYKNNIITKKKHLLLLFPGLQAMKINQRKHLYDKWIKLFKYIISFEEEFEIVVRCHPGDLSLESNKIRSLYTNHISNKSLAFDLSNSFFVIGGATTVLVDSFNSRIPCIQITDFDSENLIFPIKRYTLEDFFKLKLSSVNSLKFYPYLYKNVEFNFNKYFDFLLKHI